MDIKARAPFDEAANHARSAPYTFLRPSRRSDLWAALPHSHGFVLALLLSVLLNSIFFVIMRAPTPRGLMVLQQLAGFREFLMRVEQDRLDRVNTPEQRAELMDRFLPYAIA